jgi:hypothetical protein
MTEVNMSSLLVWRKDTKKIHCCMGESYGTIYTLQGVTECETIDWANVFSSTTIPETLGSVEAKKKIYVDENDQWHYRETMPIIIDTLTPVIIEGEAVITLSNIPVGVECFINNEFIGLTTEPDLELSFDLVGKYNVKFVLYPYLDWEEIIHATI